MSNPSKPLSSETDNDGSESSGSLKSRYTSDFVEIKRLGKGGYGSVFLCEHRIDRHLYAVKKIKFNDEEKDRTLREVYALAGCYDIRVVRYHQSWIEKIEEDTNSSDSVHSSDSGASEAKSHCLFIQMEYCPKSLFEKLEEKIEAGKAWKYFKNIVEGIRYLHTNGVIHRDLTAQNILLDHSFEIKIGDFGLAKIYKARDEPPKTSDKELGNPTYRAPEMKDKNSVIGFKVDIYSLGVILFELLYPFETRAERAQVLGDLKNHGQFPACHINARQKEFILTLLSKDPIHRPSAEMMLMERIWEIDP